MSDAFLAADKLSIGCLVIVVECKFDGLEQQA